MPDPRPLTRDGQPLIGRAAAFAPATWNADSRTIDVVWTTGADVTRMDWYSGRKWVERLTVSADAVDLSRLNTGAPVLNTHSSCDLEDVIGVVVDGSARIEAGQGTATIRFSERPEVAGIVADVAAGIIRNISVGYVVSRWDVTEASADSAEIRTAAAWTPYELSLVPIPADAGAQTRAHVPAGDVPTPPETAARAASQEPQMTDQVIDQAARDAAVTAERARVSEILLIARQTGQDESWAQAQIDAGTSADAARKAGLDAMAARGPAPVPSHRVQITRDAGDVQAAAMATALEVRAGTCGAVELTEPAREWRNATMLDIARGFLDLRGIRHRGESAYRVFEMAMSVSRRDFTPGMATSDFSNLLANTANKSLRQAYGQAPRSFLSWTRKQDLPDFKSFRGIALGGTPALLAMPEGSPVTFAGVTEAAETWQLTRAGRAVIITYEALVNDDLSGFTRLPQMFGVSAARYESEAIYSSSGILGANANMADGNALFSSAHNNVYTGGASALTVDAAGVLALGKLQELLRKQTAPNGDVLNTLGASIVVPANLEVNALQLFSGAVVPGTINAVNPYRWNVVVEARLSSATQWYLMANPLALDTVVWGYLQGEDGPRIASEMDFRSGGMALQCVHVFGAKALDWRGMVRAAGA